MYCNKFLDICPIKKKKKKKKSQNNTFYASVLNLLNTNICLKGCKEASSKLWIIGAVIGFVAMVLCVGIVFFICKKKSRYLSISIFSH